MPKGWRNNYSLCLIQIAIDRCVSNCTKSRVNWANLVLPCAPPRQFCNSLGNSLSQRERESTDFSLAIHFSAEWKVLCVSTKVSPPTIQFPKDFPEDQSKMRKIKFAFLSLATVVFLAMLLSTPLVSVNAQKSGDGDGNNGRLTYP